MTTGAAARPISVCVPTRNRPALLAEALRSIIAQTLAPAEILVGDDSTDAESAPVVAAAAATAPCPIRHLRNAPPRGQAANVDRLFQAATGARLLILHDDDLLLPEALERLGAAFADPRVVVSYGKQYVISADGRIDPASSERINVDFARVPGRVGLQPSSLAAAIMGQLPNNAYLVDAAAAKTVGYSRSGVRDACDYAFGLGLAGGGGGFAFIDQFVSCYRETPQSVQRSGGDRAAFEGLLLALRAGADRSDDPDVARWIRQRLPPAIMAAALDGERRLALAWFLRRAHWPAIPTAGGLNRLLAILSPPLATSLARATKKLRTR